MRSGVRKKWDDLNFKAESFYRKYEYRKKAKLRLKRMNGGEDKCLHDVFFKDLVRPETIVKNMAGIFYDAHMCIITKEQAIEKCMVYQGEFLIKPSIDSGEGRLISFFDSQDLDQKSLISAIDGLKANKRQLSSMRYWLR